MSDQLHFIKMNGMSSLVACSIYWALNLACPWCGGQPEKGHCGVDSITYPEAQSTAQAGERSSKP